MMKYAAPVKSNEDVKKYAQMLADNFKNKDWIELCGQLVMIQEYQISIEYHNTMVHTFIFSNGSIINISYQYEPR